MLNNNHIMSHNINIQCHMSLEHMTCATYGRLSYPTYNAITVYETT